ncbi:MAG: hypothetical protein IJ600_03410 [Lachnospiraceae bacterium]|nr:hypothetical protein [Lachnospiraceae bacterium]
MDTRTISEKYAKIGNYLIDNVPELSHLAGAEIIYLSSTAKKKSHRKRVLGQCEKVAEKNKWAIPCDFTVTLFEPNLMALSDEQIVMVIFHELLHVGAGDDIEQGHIIPHDLEDFKLMIDKFGPHWSEWGQVSMWPELTIPAAEQGASD